MTQRMGRAARISRRGWRIVLKLGLAALLSAGASLTLVTHARPILTQASQPQTFQMSQRSTPMLAEAVIKSRVLAAFRHAGSYSYREINSSSSLYIESGTYYSGTGTVVYRGGAVRYAMLGVQGDAGYCLGGPYALEAQSYFASSQVRWVIASTYPAVRCDYKPTLYQMMQQFSSPKWKLQGTRIVQGRRMYIVLTSPRSGVQWLLLIDAQTFLPHVFEAGFPEQGRLAPVEGEYYYDFGRTPTLSYPSTSYRATYAARIAWQSLLQGQQQNSFRSSTLAPSINYGGAFADTTDVTWTLTSNDITYPVVHGEAQIRDIHAQLLQVDSLSDADKANGIAWHGLVSITFIERFRETGGRNPPLPNGPYSPWMDDRRTFTVSLAHNYWKGDSHDYDGYTTQFEDVRLPLNVMKDSVACLYQHDSWCQATH